MPRKTIDLSSREAEDYGHHKEIKRDPSVPVKDSCVYLEIREHSHVTDADWPNYLITEKWHGCHNLRD